jgi:predicted transposase/invertase (TIGR01784 family)
LLRHIREWDQFPDSFSRPALSEAGQILLEGALTSEEQRIYEEIELNWQTQQLIKMDQAAKFAQTLEAEVTEAKKQEMIEGKKEGVIEGKKEGRSEMAAIAAHEFFARGVSLSDVAKILEMTNDELSQIL